MQVTIQKLKTIVLPVCALLLAACEQLGLDDGTKLAAAKEAEGRAVGSACRHSGRALEECYEKHPKISKAAIFTGWREMDGYMRENNIQIVLPEIIEAPGKKKSESGEEKPKAAEAPPAGEKQKAVDAGAEPAPGKEKTVEAPKEGPLKQGTAMPPGSRILKHVA